MGAGALVGAGKGNTHIWGEIFQFRLANLYVVVYTERVTKDIVAWDGQGPGGGLGGKRRFFGEIPPRFPVRRGTFFPANPEKREDERHESHQAQRH